MQRFLAKPHCLKLSPHGAAEYGIAQYPYTARLLKLDTRCSRLGASSHNATWEQLSLHMIGSEFGIRTVHAEGVKVALCWCVPREERWSWKTGTFHNGWSRLNKADVGVIVPTHTCLNTRIRHTEPICNIEVTLFSKQRLQQSFLSLLGLTSGSDLLDMPTRSIASITVVYIPGVRTYGSYVAPPDHHTSFLCWIASHDPSSRRLRQVEYYGANYGLVARDGQIHFK